MSQYSSSKQKAAIDLSQDNVFNNIRGSGVLEGGAGSDRFYFGQAPAAGRVIDGGTDNGLSDASVVYSGNTLTSQITYTSQDVIYIRSSMDISNLEFTHIEKIHLAQGVNLVMSSEQFENAQNSLEYTSGTSTLNPGLIIEGAAKGKPESVTIEVAKDADFQLDDASTGYLFKNVNVNIHFNGGNVRYDGTAASENIQGGDGTEYITPRLGDDIVHGAGGDDLLVGQEGADKLYGEEGNDIFLVNRLATKANGATFSVGKASDGGPELVAGDVMDGGNGTDELRITATGSSVTAIEDTVALAPDNFVGIEKVTIGTNAPRDSALYASTQDQMAAGALKAVTTGTDAINVNGSALNVGVEYTGNNGNNMLVGGSANDVFHGNGGNDILVGGAGSDKFYFETAPDAVANLDTIADFKSGTDQIVLDHAVFPSLAAGALNAGSLVAGTAAVDADDYLLFSGGKLSYDADASGPGLAVTLVQLTGVAALAATDFLVV